MTNEEIFDKACLSFKLGTRFDTTGPAEVIYLAIAKVADELIASARKLYPKLHPIHFDFINSSFVNAVAFRVGDTYFIGLTSGAVCMLNLIFHRMMAHPGNFPNVGQPAEEDPNLPPVQWAAPDPKVLYEAGYRPMGPKNLSRAEFADYLHDQALLFIIGHEIAHITRGHVDYYHAVGMPVIELGWQGTGQGKLDRQAMEVDADTRSVRSRCQSALNTADYNREQAPPWAAAPHTAEEWQLAWAFAVNTFFRLFGDARFSGTDLSRDAYPPLTLRRMLVINYVVHLLVLTWGEQRRGDAEHVMRSAVRATEAAFIALGAFPSGGGLVDTETQEAQDHLDLISNSWEKLKTTLSRYSYERL